MLSSNNWLWAGDSGGEAKRRVPPSALLVYIRRDILASQPLECMARRLAGAESFAEEALAIGATGTDVLDCTPSDIPPPIGE
jgi:hypothetical protein